MLTQHFRCEVVGIRLTFTAINGFRNGESMSFEVTVDGRDKLVVDDSSANRLGGGSQGEVFVVTYHNKKYALKWYTSPYIKKNRAFRENLRRNTMKEAPDCCFVWPQHFAENNKSFGYLMDIIDTNRFTLFSNLYTGKKRIKDPKTGKKITVDVGFDSVEPQITAAINLANAFRSLHMAWFL